MKELKFHVGNVTAFLKFGWIYGDGEGCGYGHNYGYYYGGGDGFSDGYYKIKDRQLVGDNEKT